MCISDKAYTSQQILYMEKEILEKLEWNLTVSGGPRNFIMVVGPPLLTVATPYVFLVRFIKATVSSDKEMEYMAFYLAENGLMHYQLVVSFCPSLIAAAAVYVALTYLGRTPIWTETLENYRGYSEEQLNCGSFRECAKMLIKYQMAAKDTKLKVVHLQVFEHRQGCSCAQFGSKKWKNLWWAVVLGHDCMEDEKGVDKI
ncbi:G2/mitotic-specific cyclin S13-7, partial [Bienertia sinuspersici]